MSGAFDFDFDFDFNFNLETPSEGLDTKHDTSQVILNPAEAQQPNTPNTHGASYGTPIAEHGFQNKSQASICSLHFGISLTIDLRDFSTVPEPPRPRLINFSRVAF